MPKKRILVIGAVLIAVAVFWFFDLDQYFELERLEQWVENKPIQAGIAFACLYMLVASLSLPGVGPLSLAAGAVFGLWYGVLLVSFASSIGATIGMLISRTLLREWVQKHFVKAFEKVNEGVKRDGALYLVTLRLIPPIPFFIINLVFGLTNMRAKIFYIFSQIGMLPATFLYVNAGASLGSIEKFSFFELFKPEVILSFAALIAFPFIIKAIMKYSGYGDRGLENIADDGDVDGGVESDHEQNGS